MDNLWQDLCYAARTLLKSRGLSAAAILTLALGIGATTAVFSALHAVLLSPLPFPDAERIVFVYGPALTTENFDQWQQLSRSYEHFGALSIGRLTLTGRGDAEELRALFVTEPIFPVLGIRPAIGRTFVTEDRSPGNDRTVMVSYRFWVERLEASAEALGQTLVLDRGPHTIIGVLPREMGPLPYRNVDLWIPLRPGRERGTSAVARLAPGATLESARVEAATLAERYVDPQAERPGQESIQVAFLKERIVGGSRDALLVLAGAVGFVLLIACVNVANLLLSRAAGRAREMALRTALGATRRRLIQQMLAESLLLSAVGALAGLLVAEWSLGVLLFFLPYDIPRIAESSIGGISLLFTLAALLLTTFLAGLAPALHTSRVDMTQALKEGARSATSGGGRGLRRVLVVAEVALAMAMLTGAGLLIKAFLVLRPSSPGFNAANRLTMQIDLPRYRYPENSQKAAAFHTMRERVSELPGVRAVAGATDLPFTGISSIVDVAIDGQLVGGRKQGVVIHWRCITEDFFRVMGMPMAAGRDFVSTDDTRAERVAIINQAMAQIFWPDRSPLGRKLSILWSGESDELTIVGVVRDARIYGTSSRPRPEVYQPFAQDPDARLKLVIRTAGDPLHEVANVRGVIRGVEPDAVVSQIQTLDKLLSDSVAEPRFQALLLASLAGLALALALAGIHGVLAYSVTQRTRELGIRMALGAQRSQILRLILSEGLVLAVAGIAIGAGLAAWLAQVMRSLLYEVHPADPQTFLLAVLLWLAVSAMACLIPARRATQVDPMVALRHE